MGDGFKDEDVVDYIKERHDYNIDMAFIAKCQLSLNGVLKLISLGHHVCKTFKFCYPCSVVVDNLKEICDFVISNNIMIKFFEFFCGEDESIILSSDKTPFDRARISRLYYSKSFNVDLFFDTLSFVKNITYDCSSYYYADHTPFFELIRNKTDLHTLTVRFDYNPNDLFFETFFNLCSSNKRLKELCLSNMRLEQTNMILSFIDKQTSLRDIKLFISCPYAGGRKLLKKVNDHLRKTPLLHSLVVNNQSVGKKLDTHMRQNRKMHSNVQYICTQLRCL